MRVRGLLLLTAFAAGALAVLLGLGIWQLQRLQWKEGLIAEIEARTKAEPISLDEAVALARKGEDVSYLRVRAEGKLRSRQGALFLHQRRRHRRLGRDHAADHADGRGGADRSGLRARRAERPGIAAARRDRGTPSRSPGSRGPPRRKAASSRTTMLPATAGSGAISTAWPDPCSRAAPRTSRPSSSRRKRAMSRAAGPVAARPGSISPTTICNTRSPGLRIAFCLVVIYVLYVRSRWRRGGLGESPVAGKGPGS